MNETGRVLVIESQDSDRESLIRQLRLEHCDVAEAANPGQAIKCLSEPIDLVIGDPRNGKDELELLRQWKARRPEIPFIVTTDQADINSAVESMKLGAVDYMTKPIHIDELKMLVGKCLEMRHKNSTLADLQDQLDQRLGLEHLVGQSPPMVEVVARTRRAALTDSTVLITGESGTGKELIAQAIHHNSLRKKQVFVTVNMAAVPEHLAESELFGHAKGSFTGATDSRVGRFEVASGGTIFIDEIGDFKRECQVKLLRVLESRTVTPIGCNDDREVDVRVVAATSRNLEQMLVSGEFREDLYYRLNVINLHLPPLRERRDDIPLLVNYFLTQICRHVDKPLPRLSDELAEHLWSHPWPGNVRQLRNCLESMVVLAESEVLTLQDIPRMLDEGPSLAAVASISPSTTLHDLERTAVEQALDRHHGNRTWAARSLGISVRTLQRKLKAWESEGKLLRLIGNDGPLSCNYFSVKGQALRHR